MTSLETKREVAEANRRRYEELRAAGQEATPKALPSATALGAAPILENAVISREEIPADWYAIARLRRGGVADRRSIRPLQRVRDRLA